MAGPVVALDVGGTAIKTAVMTPEGPVGAVERQATERERGADAVVERILDVAERVTEAARNSSDQPPTALGVAVPGHVDEGAGIAHFSENIGWRDVALRDRLEERVGLPVALAHDVRAGGFAESRLGSGAGADPFVFIAIGTGLAAAIVAGGRVIRGRLNLAGEIGHIRVESSVEPCGCGSFGCLEGVFSGGALVRRYSAATGGTVTAEEITALAADGDPDAIRVWQSGIDAFAEVLAALVAVIDPQRIAFGGGVAEAGAQLFVPLTAALREHLPFAGPPDLVPAGLGADAGVIGAGLAALDLVP